jgi:FG-GAP-like repeat
MELKRIEFANTASRANLLGVIWMFGLAVIGCGSSTPRIDSTTYESFNASLAAMKAGMSKAEAGKLDGAVQFYTSAATPASTTKFVTNGMAKDKKSFNAMTKDDLVRGLMVEIYAPLHGLTAPEVVEKCMTAGREHQKKLEETMAKARADQAKQPPRVPPRDEGVEPAWSLIDPYEALAADPTGQSLYAVLKQGRCDVVDLEGKIHRTMNLEGFTPASAQAGTLRVHTARIAKGEDALIIHSNETSILAYRTDGTKLWSYLGAPRKGLGGLDDLAVVDLDGDGVDELVAGYGGSPGLQVFSTQGKPLWERPELGNCWNVAVGDLDGDGKQEVISTSAKGKFHLFAPKDGSPLRTLDPGFYATIIRTAPGKSLGVPRGDVILTTGTDRTPPGPVYSTLVAVGGEGKKLWSLKLSESFSHCRSLSVSHDGLWAAVLLVDRIRIVDLARSRVVGQVVVPIVGQGPEVTFTWVNRVAGHSPLLVVATGDALNAFRLKSVDPSPGAQ